MDPYRMGSRHCITLKGAKTACNELALLIEIQTLKPQGTSWWAPTAEIPLIPIHFLLNLPLILSQLSKFITIGTQSRMIFGQIFSIAMVTRSSVKDEVDIG